MFHGSVVVQKEQVGLTCYGDPRLNDAEVDHRTVAGQFKQLNRGLGHFHQGSSCGYDVEVYYAPVYSFVSSEKNVALGPTPPPPKLLVKATFSELKPQVFSLLK